MSDNEIANKWTKAKIRKFLGPTLVVLGLFYTYRSHLNACPRELIFAGWAVLPPVWLILEYWLLFDRAEESLADFEVFKHGQTLARNLWGGFLIFLAAFYLGEWGG
ncbi:uncharacterized protein METZ01_LOCUS501810 [marine metagenome]|uniref:Uncharacterized protein n=1 Tax=marine metagenome TaxID=408172 RepID=A0A383DWP9_9ZZZZ